MEPPLSSFSLNSVPPCVEKEAFPLVSAFHSLSLTSTPGVTVGLGALAKELVDMSLVFTPIFGLFLACIAKGGFYWHFPTWGSEPFP
jgi:hypothetical protein